MEDLAIVARPYALAAFRQAREEGRVAEWGDMLARLALVESDPTMKGLIANPRVNDRALGGLVADVVGDALSDTGRNFVRLLAHNGRLGCLAEIESIFRRERERAEGRSRVVVTSAFALTDEQRRRIAESVARRLGTEVELSEEVDESLIGGAVIRAGDLVIDGSLRGRLQHLAQSLA